MDKPLEIKKQYRSYFVKKLQNYFKVTKEEVLEGNNIDTEELMFFDVLRDRYDFDYVCYVTHSHELKLSQLFQGEKFVKSQIYAEFLNGEAGLKEGWKNRFLMVLHVNGFMFVMFRANEYAGDGGIFINAPDSETFVLEPVENFLSFQFPPPQF